MIAISSFVWRTIHVALSASFVIVLGLTTPQSASAQTRAALVRDTDNPDLSPTFLSVSYPFSSLNSQALAATVPPGKRFVVDNVSYEAGNVGSDQLVYAALRAGQFGPIRLRFPINPPHAAVTSGYSLQDGSFAGRTYFEAGEEIWVSASHTSNVSSSINVYITGHYVTP